MSSVARNTKGGSEGAGPFARQPRARVTEQLPKRRWGRPASSTTLLGWDVRERDVATVVTLARLPCLARERVPIQDFSRAGHARNDRTISEGVAAFDGCSFTRTALLAGRNIAQ
jgi:hypothetical protein